MTRIDTDSGLGLAYPMVDTNTHSVMEELEEKILHQFEWLTVIYSDEGTHFTAPSVQQWKERYPSQSNSFNRKLEWTMKTLVV